MILAAAMPLYAAMLAAGAEPASLVRPMMGTGAAGCVVPVAAAPFGMVQLGPDTYFTSSGYHYDHDVIYGFSHTHKSGGGGTDFQDIMFFPVADSAWQRLEVYPDRVGSRFSHEREHVEPGYYRVRLLDSDIEAELTATSRCGMHRYAYPDGAARQLIVDLKHGCQHSTTIFADEDFDTVKVSRLEWVDERTVRGFRISNGWAPEQHVYFYAEFSEPIRSCRFFDHGRSVEGIRELEGTDVRAVLNFGGRDGRPLVARVGISPVSMEGARENLSAEIKGWNFDRVRSSAYSAWNEQLSAVRIEGGEPSRREVFYTSLYYAMLYRDGRVSELRLESVPGRLPLFRRRAESVGYVPGAESADRYPAARRHARSDEDDARALSPLRPATYLDACGSREYVHDRVPFDAGDSRCL